MPTISTFFGITITMYADDHNPPHFHARYGGEQAVYDIQTLECLKGRLPRRADAMIREWAAAHQVELFDNWTRAQNIQPTQRIEPLT